jgi:hypothetical protein
MDVADAVNVMLYASPRHMPGDPAPSTETDAGTNVPLSKSTSEPGCAVWDLYRAEDAPFIRLFLRNKFGHREKFTDPIHSQLFYLDASLRKELFDIHGVRGWRIYQYPVSQMFNGEIAKERLMQYTHRGKRCSYRLDVLIRFVILRIALRLHWILSVHVSRHVISTFPDSR